MPITGYASAGKHPSSVAGPVVSSNQAKSPTNGSDRSEGLYC